jgi:hypothetical protein
MQRQVLPSAELLASKKQTAFSAKCAITLLTVNTTSLSMSEHIQERGHINASTVTIGLQKKGILLHMSERTQKTSFFSANFVIIELQKKAISLHIREHTRERSHINASIVTTGLQ